MHMQPFTVHSRPRCCPLRENAVGQRATHVAHAASEDDAKNALNERIASGKYSVKGSKKERITRSARKLLSMDKLGPGGVAIPKHAAE
jgi:hypothetical protein